MTSPPKYQLDYESWRDAAQPPWEDIPLSVRILAVALMEVDPQVDMAVVMVDLIAAAAVAARTKHVDLVSFLEQAAAVYQARVADEERICDEKEEIRGIQN